MSEKRNGLLPATVLSEKNSCSKTEDMEVHMRSTKEYKAIREEIYHFIGTYIAKHVYAPSNQEIAEAVGISKATVHRHLSDMLDDGILETDAEPGTQRAIRIRSTHVVKRREKSCCR